MLCPIFINAMIQTGRTDVAGETPCLKEKCAWWDATAEKCVVLQLAFEIDKVQDRLERMLDKMPHEEQFRG